MATSKDKPHHIGKNGPAPCTASPGNCPLGGESGYENHFPNYDAADRAFGEQNKEMQFATHSKKSVVDNQIPLRHAEALTSLPGKFTAHQENFEDEIRYDYDAWGEGEAMGWASAYTQYSALCLDNDDGAFQAENVQKFISSMQEKIDQIEGKSTGDESAQGIVAAMRSSVSMAKEALSKSRDSWKRERDAGKGAVEMASLSRKLEEINNSLGESGAGENSSYSGAEDNGRIEAMSKYAKALEPVVDEYNQTGSYNDATMAKAVATLESAQSKAQRAGSKNEAISLGDMARDLRAIREAALADDPVERKARDAMDEISTLSQDTRRALESVGSNGAIDEARRSALARLDGHGALIEKEFQATGKFPESAVRHAIGDLERAASGAEDKGTSEGEEESEILMRGVQSLKAAQRRNMAPNAEEAMNQLSAYAAESRSHLRRAYQGMGSDDYNYKNNSEEINTIINAYQQRGEFDQGALNSSIARAERNVASTKDTVARGIHESHLERLRSIRNISQTPRSSTPATTVVPLSREATQEMRMKQGEMEVARGNVEKANIAVDAARRATRDAENHFILGRDRKMKEAQEQMSRASQALQSADVHYMRSSTNVNRYVRSLKVSMNLNGEATTDENGNYFINVNP